MDEARLHFYFEQDFLYFIVHIY